MAEKLIGLSQLQEYKIHADSKYQNKLTAGSNVNISGNTISASSTPTFVKFINTGKIFVDSSTVVAGTITLLPGLYLIFYSCLFSSNSSGIRGCGFSDTNVSSFSSLYHYGYAYHDTKKAVIDAATQTAIQAIVEVKASDYPNGRTFYFLAAHTAVTTITITPRVYYFKF